MPEAARILILGGYGSTGRCLSRLLLANCDVEVTIAGRNEHRAATLASQLGSRCRFAQVDAADRRALHHVLPMHRLVVLAAPGRELPGIVARAALDCGCDYLDISYGSAKIDALRQLAEPASAAGRCMVTEAGFHPGLPSVLVRWAAMQCETLQAAEIASVIRPRIDATREMPASVGEFVDDIAASKSAEFLDGQWRELRWWQWPYRWFEFGRQWGKLPCVPLDFEELHAAVEAFPTLRQLRFSMAGFGPIVDWIVLPFLLAAQAVAPTRTTEACAKILWQSLRFWTKPPFGTTLAVKYEGTAGQGFLALEHPDEYEFTAIPVVAFLMQLLDGSAWAPGLHYMGMLADPARLLADMQRMGIQTRRV